MAFSVFAIFAYITLFYRNNYIFLRYVFISLGLSLIYLLGLKTTSLVEVMRGASLRRLLRVMFLGQNSFAIVVVSITVGVRC